MLKRTTFQLRVRTYDSDMDIMHPLRAKMIDIALTILPFDPAQPLTALDLGVGTGEFSKRFLEEYPNSQIVAIDGAAAMLEVAQSRLRELARRVQWIVADFQSIPSTVLQPETYDVVISSYALHHLTRSEKRTLLTSVVNALRPGGWLLNADIVMAETPAIERRIQDIRVSAVTARAPRDDQRFANVAATRQFLDDLEAAENDRPQTMEADLSIFREAGIATAEVLWKEFREVVMGGPKASG